MSHESECGTDPFPESEQMLLAGFHSSSDSSGHCTCENKSSWKWRMILPWILCLLLVTSLAISVTFSAADRSVDGYWRENEFKTVVSEIPAVLNQIQFDATLKYNESHQVYRPITDPPFVGSPSPEIDRAWEKLLGAVNVFVTPEEEHLLGGDLWLDPETGLYMAQVSVFHDLRCINFIRKSMHPEYYPELQDWTLGTHVEHCLDALRLSLMCSGDMTLMPIKCSDNRGWIVPIFETVHTCRDYDTLRSWSKNRDAADPDTFYRNAERLRSESNRSTR